MQVDNFRGVYSTRETNHTSSFGAGKTRKRYWLAWTGEEGTITVQPLGPDLEPAGAKRIIGVEDFIEQYAHEPEVIPSYSLNDPDKQEGWERISAAPADEDGLQRDVRRQSVDLDDLDFLKPEEEKARQEAIFELEHETRAEFGLAITHLRRGNELMAIELFKRLTEGDFVAEHKHMFTDFGISLRKSKLLEPALHQHLKALELSPQDDHIYHNIARVYYEMGDFTNTLRYLKKCIELNPSLKPAQQFMSFLKKHHSDVLRFT